MQSGADAALNPIERIFFYTPLQHAEAPDVQDESIAAYRRLLGEAPQPLQAAFKSSVEFAERHRALILRFGRFPHRNRVLDRADTPDEAAYLRDAAETFAQ
jgi:uncharacterized protein (DUF924 family)